MFKLLNVRMKLAYFIIILYLYVYNPVFNLIGIGSVKVILLFFIFYSLFNKKILHHLSYFKIEFIFTILLVTYSFFTSLRSNDLTFYQSYLFFIWFLESIYIPIVLIAVFINELEKYNWDKLILIVGVIASLLTLILILNPELNSYVKYTLIASSGEEGDSYTFIRGFGFAEGLRGTYGMVQGMILGICVKKVRENWLYVIIGLLLLISIAFNARTGLIALPVSTLIILFSFNFNNRFIIYFIITLSLIYYIDFSTISIFADNQETLSWLIKGFEDVNAIFQGRSSNVGDVLFVDEVFFPSNVYEFIFGTGNFGPGNYRVDNGYYYLLWFGGWLIMMVVFLFLIYMSFKIYVLEKDHYYTFLFIILLLIYSVKSNYLFNPSAMSRLFGYYYVYNILNHKLKFKYNV